MGAIPSLQQASVAPAFKRAADGGLRVRCTRRAAFSASRARTRDRHAPSFVVNETSSGGMAGAQHVSLMSGVNTERLFSSASRSRLAQPLRVRHDPPSVLTNYFGGRSAGNEACASLRGRINLFTNH
jgi:hypothetical protein